MKYKLLVGLAAALASSLLVTAAAKAADESAVTIAVGVDPAFTPFFVADAQGLFKKHGLNVQIQQLANAGVRPGRRVATRRHRKRRRIRQESVRAGFGARA